MYRVAHIPLQGASFAGAPRASATVPETWRIWRFEGCPCAVEVEGKVEADCLNFLSPDSALDIRPISTSTSP